MKKGLSGELSWSRLRGFPKERIAVLIGKGGATRKMIEDAVGVKIHIDSESGEVSASWPEDADLLQNKITRYN